MVKSTYLPRRLGVDWPALARPPRGSCELEGVPAGTEGPKLLTSSCTIDPRRIVTTVASSRLTGSAEAGELRSVCGPRGGCRAPPARGHGDHATAAGTSSEAREDERRPVEWLVEGAAPAEQDAPAPLL